MSRRNNRVSPDMFDSQFEDESQINPVLNGKYHFYMPCNLQLNLQFNCTCQ